MADDALTGKEAEMGRLTKEQVEMLRQGLLNSEWCGYSKRGTVNALCDLALRALSLESVREEALEEAARLILSRYTPLDKFCAMDIVNAIRALHAPARVAEGVEQPWQRTRREILIEAAMKCRDIQYEHRGLLYENAEPNVKTYHDGMAKGADVCEYAIRNLAESPTKEQPGEQNTSGWTATGSDEDYIRPAAPDAAAMAKRLREVAGGADTKFGEDAKLMTEAATLIEKLGQDSKENDAEGLAQAVERLLSDHDNCGELSQHNLDFARCCLKNKTGQVRKLERMKILLNRWHSSATQNDIPDLAELIKDTEHEIL